MTRKSMLLPAIVVLVLVTHTNGALAQRKSASYKLKKNLRKMSFVLPQYLDFTLRNGGTEANIFTAQPFAIGETLVLDERYVSSYYPEISLVHLCSAGAYEGEDTFVSSVAKKQGIVLNWKREKFFGTKGFIYKLKQRFPTGTYHKIVAVFGNEYQTHSVLALYPEHYESTFVPSLLERSVETAKVTDVPFLDE